ncbi:MAG: glycosyltransferase family 39 protein [Pseudolabrys sp.]
MPSLQFPSAVRRAAGGLRDAFVVSPARERNVALALLLYAVVWAVYGAIAKGPQGLHPDMTELIAWSRELAWGYAKHGPVAAVLAWAWFSVLPVAEWSYYLLAMLMPAAALWIMWRLSADYLDIEKRVAGVALMTFVPFFNFHALKYNVNTVLLPMWALTAWWFLRAYERQSVFYAALAGLAAAAAMMTKYWSVFLLAGLVVAALTDTRRARYFRSPAPWVTVLAGLALLAPHLIWLTQHDYAPFSYAITVHGEDTFLANVKSAFGYLGGSLGYVAVPVVVVLLMVRPDRATLAEMVWPRSPSRRLVATAFWAPFLLPVVAALAGLVEITSLWSMSAFALLLMLLLSPEAAKVSPVHTGRILVAATVFPLVMLIAAPFIAVAGQRKGPPPASALAARLAARVEHDWHALTPKPLRYVGGPEDLAYGVAAYAADRPRSLPNLPQPSAATLKRDGAVFVCFAADMGCRQNAGRQAARLGASHLTTFTLARTYLGVEGRPQNYAVRLVPPER